MQAWDVVKVANTEHDYAGKVGIVLRAHDDKQIAAVKIDEIELPQAFAYSELSNIG